jgi:hypothetical protein
MVFWVNVFVMAWFGAATVRDKMGATARQGGAKGTPLCSPLLSSLSLCRQRIFLWPVSSGFAAFSQGSL